MKDDMKKSGILKVGRNDPCPCGSGRKYKKCCLNKPVKGEDGIGPYYEKRYGIRLKGPDDIKGIREAGKLVIMALDRVESMIRPGMATIEIDKVVADIAKEYGAISAPLNYKGFPASVCTSVNSVICHGIPGQRVLKDGDIINVDVTYVLNGYYADASKTYFVGTPSDDAEKIVSVSAGSLAAAMEVLSPGRTIGDIGWAIQEYAHAHGCSVVREFVGHGVGFEFHEPPQIPHFGQKGRGIELVPGMVFTIEPMINLGGRELYIEADGWTAVTADGSLSAQFEQTFLITEQGYESLTPYQLEPWIKTR